jgi:hypothetical protein
MRSWLYPWMERTRWVDCTPWVRQENERRKGRKGRKPLAQIRRVGFSNDINDLGYTLRQPVCAARARRKRAETGGNSLHPPELIGVTLAEIAEIPSSVT